MKAFSLIILSLFLNSTAFAGAIEYKSIPELENQMANLVCSSIGKNGHTHLQLALEKNKVVEFLIFGVAPAKAASLIEVRKIKWNQVIFLGQNLKIKAVGAGSYFDPELELSISEVPGQAAWSGKLFFDDGDGISFEKEVICGATNYQFMPR